MNYVKTGLILGVAACAMTANAQFGTANKADLLPIDGKSGIYGTGTWLTERVSGGGGSATGLLFNAEKALSINGDDVLALGAFFADVDGTTYSIYAKKYLGVNYGVQLGLLKASGNDDLNYTLFGIYDFTEAKDGATRVQGGLGTYYTGFNSEFNLSAFVKASHPLQNGLSIDGTIWYTDFDGFRSTTFALGVGYKF